MEKKSHVQVVIPVVTAIISLIFIGTGLVSYGFWDQQPTPGFFPIIIAVVLLAASILCIVQLLGSGDDKPVKYTKAELMVILGGGAVIVGTYLIGLVISCLLFIIAWLRIVERAPWKAVIVIEVVMAAIILGVFVTWLQVRFPVGLLGEMFL